MNKLVFISARRRICFLFSIEREFDGSRFDERDGMETNLSTLQPRFDNWIGGISVERVSRVNFDRRRNEREVTNRKAVSLSDLHTHAVGRRRKVSNFQFRNFKTVPVATSAIPRASFEFSTVCKYFRPFSICCYFPRPFPIPIPYIYMYTHTHTHMNLFSPCWRRWGR